ncbi:hypothetical protein [Teredinibacter turnerae]|uniref:hypothetical protein n=1 Tax=Teredinibacter turnerae TaxID=2426 RepID=UPI0003745E7E|nr:hypothetical protein [Teredinibacter turnerae]
MFLGLGKKAFISVVLCICVVSSADALQPSYVSASPDASMDGSFSVSWSFWTGPAGQEPEGACEWFAVSIKRNNEPYDYAEIDCDAPHSYSVSNFPTGTYQIVVSVFDSSHTEHAAAPVKAAVVRETFGDNYFVFPEMGFVTWTNTGGSYTAEPWAGMTWTRQTGATPSSGTGPSGPATGSAYFYMETSSGQAYTSGQHVVMKSPMILLAGKVLKFSYHMYGADIGSLLVAVESVFGRHTVWSVSGQQNTSSSSPWHEVTIPLAGEAGVGKIWIEAVARGGYRGDIAIDEIKVVDAFTGVDGPVVITYEYDVFGQLKEVGQSGTAVNGYSYTKTGNRNSEYE